MTLLPETTRTESNRAEATRPVRSRNVKHWARIWFGKPETHDDHGNERPFTRWFPDENEILVCEQLYGEPRWFESLCTQIIATGRELLSKANPEYDSVRLRVMIYSHQTDGQNSKFTLEHIERRPYA